MLTGMSGAGRSTAADAMEDLGWFVVDNLPAALIPKIAELARSPEGSFEKVVLVVGSGPGSGAEAVLDALDAVRAGGSSVRVVFLESSTDALVRRYENTRRPHPHPGDSLVESIEGERSRLEDVKATADLTVDTTDLNVHQLRERIVGAFEDDESAGMQTSIVSFGYKHGLPLDVDLVLDCRFLPNPHWVPELRPLTGRDDPVRDYVLSKPEAGEFLDRLDNLLELLMPAYVAEGKAYLTIAVGCTGGRHRSVAIAERLGELLRIRGHAPRVTHRDVER